MGKSLSELKGSVKPASVEQRTPYQYAPMFLPMDVESKKDDGVIKVVTRGKFLLDAIKVWREYHLYRSASLVLGFLCGVFLLTGNWVIAGVFGIGAGYSYGKFKYADHLVHILKTRWLYETT